MSMIRESKPAMDDKDGQPRPFKRSQIVMALLLCVVLTFTLHAPGVPSGWSPEVESYASVEPKVSGESSPLSEPLHLQKIVLTPRMVINESKAGTPVALVDEQSVVGNPAYNPAGKPITIWGAEDFNGSKYKYPIYAQINLGRVFQIDYIFLRDLNSSGEVRIYSGRPGSWTLLTTDSLSSYARWNKHRVSVKTRYLRIAKASHSANFSEMVLYGYPLTPAKMATPSRFKATPVGIDAINLSWVSPTPRYDHGPAPTYDLRISTSRITTKNWQTATRLPGTPAPKAGTVQTHRVDGLAPNRTYHFAIRSVDTWGNRSSLRTISARTRASAVDLKLTSKLHLQPSMVLTEIGQGEASMLVDEQAAIGDPRQQFPQNINGSWPNVPDEWQPKEPWNPGYNTDYYPAAAIIDLGRTHYLSDLGLFDSNSTGSFKVSAGVPGRWHQLVDDPQTQYNRWVLHKLDVYTRYVRVELSNKFNMNELVLYGVPIGQPDSVPALSLTAQSGGGHMQPLIKDFMGANSFVYEDPELEHLQAVGYVREYQNWPWLEGAKNQHNFWGSFGFSEWYGKLKERGMLVAPAMQKNAPWLAADSSQSEHKPLDFPDASDPRSYASHSSHLYQMAARFGASAVPSENLRTVHWAPDLNTGLNLLTYYENWNEQNKTWFGRAGYFSPFEFAAMTSAGYDGHRGVMGRHAGLKNADPNAKLVLGGTVGLDLDYVKAMNLWFRYHRNGQLPYEVLNFHMYSTKNGVGISPEADGVREQVERLVSYRDSHLPGKEIWLTEFGYDTHPQSTQRAPQIAGYSQEEVQGQWLVRYYLALAAAGVDRAAMYMLKDVNGTDDTKYATSGLLRDDYTRKPSWYYVYTMKNRLGGMRFVDEQASGRADVNIYRFRNPVTSETAYVVWCPTSDGKVVEDYPLQLAMETGNVSVVSLTNGSTNGIAETLTVVDGKVALEVSERPLFVMVDGN